MSVDQNDRRRQMHADIPGAGGMIDLREDVHTHLLDGVHEDLDGFRKTQAALVFDVVAFGHFPAFSRTSLPIREARREQEVRQTCAAGQAASFTIARSASGPYCCGLDVATLSAAKAGRSSPLRRAGRPLQNPR